MLTASPSHILSGANCLRKLHFYKHLRLATVKYPWQQIGIDVHEAIDHYLLTGERREEPEHVKLGLQLAMPYIDHLEIPYRGTEVECITPAFKGWGWKKKDLASDEVGLCEKCGELQTETPSGMACCNGHGGAPTSIEGVHLKKDGHLLIDLPDWVGRTDFKWHCYADLWPYPDEMTTLDWKVRANMSFLNTPTEDLRDDPQAVGYQLMRSYVLTGTWEEPGEHVWVIIDRKAWRSDKVSVRYARGEALERWRRTHEPMIDIMLDVFGDDPKSVDPVDVPDNGYYAPEQECRKWRGCDYARRCQACGTPVFAAVGGMLRDYKRKNRDRKQIHDARSILRRIADAS